jgi:cytoskeleton protein RodZ
MSEKKNDKTGENAITTQIIDPENSGPTPTLATNSSEIGLGEYLKSKREEKELSIKNVSQKTKITLTLLKHLENDRKDDLPNVAYIKGFIKSYTKALGIPEKEAMTYFERTYMEEEETIEPEEKEIEEEKRTETAREIKQQDLLKAMGPIGHLTMKYLKYIVPGFGLIIIVSSLLLSRNEEAPQETSSNPISTHSVSEKTPLKMEASNAVVEVVKPEAAVEKVVPVKPETPVIEATPVIVEKVVEKKEVKEAANETIKEEAIKKPIEKDMELKKEINFYPMPQDYFAFSDDQSIYKDLPEHIKNAYSSDKEHLFINATKDDSWITYKSDDGPIKKFVLKKGRTLLIRGNTIRIFLGNINATSLFYNNKAISIHSVTGVKSLVFPKEASLDLKLPLFVYLKSGKVVTSDEYLTSTNNPD